MSKLAYRICGSDMQLIEIALPAGESVLAETGSMIYMLGDVGMQTLIRGGITGGVKRLLGGENLFLSQFKNNGRSKAIVAFGAPYPGKIINIQLVEHNGAIIAQKGAYLSSDDDVKIDVAFTKKIAAGLFGGEGFILQKLTGAGQVFLHAGGTVIERKLEAGQTLKVDTGCLVAFSNTITYDVGFVGGVRNTLFGKEGLFLANLTGPGKVYLQSLPINRLADKIHSSRKKFIDEKHFSKSESRDDSPRYWNGQIK